MKTKEIFLRIFAILLLLLAIPFINILIALIYHDSLLSGLSNGFINDAVIIAIIVIIDINFLKEITHFIEYNLRLLFNK